MQHAADERRAGVQELEVVFLQVEEGCARANGGVGAGEERRRGPEDVVVVREHGEEDAEEEACCWRGGVSLGVFFADENMCEDLRPTIRKVAKGATPRRAILSVGGGDVSLMCGVGVVKSATYGREPSRS